MPLMLENCGDSRVPGTECSCESRVRDATGLQRQLVPGRETHSRQETEIQIGTPCRVRLDIYLVGYERKGEKREEQREGQRERDRQTETDRERQRERERWKRKELGLEAEDQLTSVKREEWAWLVS